MGGPRPPEALRGQVEENLRQLGRDHLDVVNLRIVGTDSIAERFGALAELRQAGLIRHLGLSDVTPATSPRPRPSPRWSAYRTGTGSACGPRTTRRPGLRGAGDRLRPVLRDSRGRRRGRRDRGKTAEVLAVAQAHGVGPAEIRLAWTLHQGPHVLAIPGTGDPGHLAANVAAGALSLSRTS
ncbi:Oxidoreductase OS=Streptomyces cyaneofuscatus OX=66883 GN=G3I52_13655 PE=4 SV=1 [Streptomyces cyaneofuscatus]